LDTLVTRPDRHPARRRGLPWCGDSSPRCRWSNERRPITIRTPAPTTRSVSKASWDARINEDTPAADRIPQIRTPALLPTIADNAARRPSRAATRRMVAVPGPGVRVTTTAIIRNSVSDRMSRRYGCADARAKNLRRSAPTTNTAGVIGDNHPSRCTRYRPCTSSARCGTGPSPGSRRMARIWTAQVQPAVTGGAVVEGRDGVRIGQPPGAAGVACRPWMSIIQIDRPT